MLFAPPHRQEASSPNILSGQQDPAQPIDIVESPTSRQGYFIQAGAFASKQNADRVIQKLSHIGHAFVDSLQRSRGLLYRVRVGPYPSHESASDRLHELYKIGIKDATVVAVR